MSTEPRDERELNTALAVHTPKWLPGVTVNFSFRRLWDKRQERFSQVVSDATGQTLEELEERIEQADGLTDLVGIAAWRAGERGDPEYVDTLARLVAAAFINCARLDTTAYVLDRIVKLEPIHVRLLVKLVEAEQLSDEIRDLQTYPLVVGDEIRLEAAARALELDEGIVESCLSDLASVGFAERMQVEPGSLVGGAGKGSVPKWWSLTRLGISAGVEINRVRQNLSKTDGS